MSAFILEKNHFPVEAAKYYKTAFELEPENVVYKHAFSRFSN